MSVQLARGFFRCEGPLAFASFSSSLLGVKTNTGRLGLGLAVASNAEVSVPCRSPSSCSCSSQAWISTNFFYELPSNKAFVSHQLEFQLGDFSFKFRSLTTERIFRREVKRKKLVRFCLRASFLNLVSHSAAIMMHEKSIEHFFFLLNMSNIFALSLAPTLNCQNLAK